MDADIAIIGGGVAGVAAAARLAAHARVLLLEAETALAYHASGRSAAMFLQSYGNATVRALNDASADFLRTFEGGVLSRRGMLMLAHAEETDAFEIEARDVGLSPMSLDDAKAMFPILDRDTIAHVGYRDDVFDLDTGLLIERFRRMARAGDADFVTGARVSTIARCRSGWRIEWTGGDATVARIVNAAGAWADEIAAMAGVAPLGLQAYRRSMARLAAPGGHDVSDWPFVDGVGESWYAKPDAGAWLVSPSEAHAMEPFDAWPDDMVLAEGLARYERAVTEPVTRPLATWAGLRTFAPDRALVIGTDSQVPEFWWCAAQGGYGFQTAPAASALLADMLCGRMPDLDRKTVAALSPARFS